MKRALQLTPDLLRAYSRRGNFHSDRDAAAGLGYSKLVARLKKAQIALDRKILADLALRDPGGFKAVVDAAK